MKTILRDLPPSSQNSFNAVRLLAALQVVYFHTYAHLKLPPIPIHAFLAQFPGVPIFFAISGFLIVHSASVSNSLLNYAIRRAARIYPALATNIIVMEAFVWLLGQANYANKSPIHVIWYEIVYIFTASDGIARHLIPSGAASRDWTGLLPFYPSGVLWTLTVELSFYVLVPILVWICRSRAVLTILIVMLALASFAYTSAIGVNAESFPNYLLSISIVPYFWIFAVGALFRLFLPSPKVTVFSVIVLAVSYYVYISSKGMMWLQWKYTPGVEELFQVLILALLMLFIGVSPILKSRALNSIDVSYGVYLYHMLVVAIFSGVGLKQDVWLLLPVYALSISLGLASWFIVERRAIVVASRKREKR